MNNLSAAIYMTAEGIPFLQAGEEMLRTKMDASGGFVENSYNSPDSVNSLKWDTLDDETYQKVYNYYKGLIAFRKAHAALRLTNAQDVADTVAAVDGLYENVVAFQLKGGVNNEASDGIFIIFNPNTTETSVTLPDGAWDVCVNADTAGTEAITTVSGTATVEPISAMVLVKNNSAATPSTENTDTAFGVSKNRPGVAVAVGAGIVAACGAAAYVFHKKRK